MTILKKLVAASAGALIVLQTLAASAAPVDAIMWVNGPKGEIDGQAQRDRRATTLVDFAHGPTKPGDLKAALASGKKVHEPIVVIMRLDHATAELWKALRQQDKLQVRFSFYRPAAAAAMTTPAAMQQPYYTLSLGDATVEKLELLSPESVQDPGGKSGATYVRVQLAFRTIDWTWNDGGKTFNDDWTM
jgi:type VI secretion system Hcp family effector